LNTEHSESVASIQICFEGAKLPQGSGADGPKPEAGRAENGVGVLGMGSKPPLHQLGVFGSVVSSPNLKFGAT